MKTQTIFSDPAIARSIATAIHLRTVTANRPRSPNLILDWFRHLLHRKEI